MQQEENLLKRDRLLKLAATPLSFKLHQEEDNMIV